MPTPPALLTALFPSLREKRWTEIDFAACAREWLKGVPAEQNPLLDPAQFQSHLDQFHSQKGASYSYGSYLEDRSELLRGAYMVQEGKPIHLGVDINVPANTPLCAGLSARVVVVDDDHDPEGGWGPRVIVTPTDPKKSAISVIYGHLADILVQPGDALLPAQEIARVGAPPLNGNWFPHLHVQLVRTDFLMQLITTGQLGTLDGYGSRRDLARLKDLFPDPLHQFPA